MENIKEILVNHFRKIIDIRIETANRDIQIAKESRDNETKSTAGDKYDTGRAMVQFELEKNMEQLNKVIQLKNELAQIDLFGKFSVAGFGSIVKTTHDNYFISIGLGKINIGQEIYYAISPASPIGKILNKKNTGDEVNILGEKIIITEIV